MTAGGGLADGLGFAPSFCATKMRSSSFANFNCCISNCNSKNLKCNFSFAKYTSKESVDAIAMALEPKWLTMVDNNDYNNGYGD